MIISHKHKFIFIKTYKTAGTSLEVYLSRYCQDADVITEIYPSVPGHNPRNSENFYNHMPAVKIKNQVGEMIWNSYYKFCIERNPWDKVLSFFWMERYRSNGNLCLDEFLERDEIGINWFLYTDEREERPIVDRVLRYENLNSELQAVFEKIGIPWYGSLEVRAKGEYRLDRRHYQDVLTKKQAAQISEKFSKEINWHGYQY